MSVGRSYSPEVSNRRSGNPLIFNKNKFEYPLEFVNLESLIRRKWLNKFYQTKESGGDLKRHYSKGIVSNVKKCNFISMGN